MPTRDELIKALHKAYDAMYSEYMACPWCTGHIGHENETHDEDCIWLSIRGEHLTLLEGQHDAHHSSS